MKKYTELTFQYKIRLEEEFYSKPLLVSYSALNKLINSPTSYYRHYVLNQREDIDTSSTIEGRLLHCLLLTPELFNDEFVLMNNKVPGDNIKKLLDHVFEFYLAELNNAGDDVLGVILPPKVRERLEEFSTEILEYLREINLYQSLVDDKKDLALTGDVKRLQKVITDDNIEYFEYLKISIGKTIISYETFELIQEGVEKIKENKQIMRIMGFVKDFFNKTEVFNEHKFEYLLNENFGIKGIIDNLVFDYDNKVIRINDLKTTSKTLANFKDSIEYYRYWIQAAIYYRFIVNQYIVKKEFDAWRIEVRFIVVDSYAQPASILISDNTINEWSEKTDVLLEQAEYHFNKQNYELPYEYLINGNELVI